MDVLRKELNSFYESQNLDHENLDRAILTECKHCVETAAHVEGDCRVITDAAADCCHIFGRRFPRLIGLSDSSTYLDYLPRVRKKYSSLSHTPANRQST